MALSNKVIKTQLEARRKLRNMAKKAQEYVRKMLPLGPTNINREVSLSLTEKVNSVFIKSHYILEGLLQDPAFKAEVAKVPAFVKEKMLHCNIETLRLMMERFERELKDTKFDFTDKELQILPALCAASIGKILFEGEKKRSIMEDQGVVKIKKFADIACVTGTGHCGEVTDVGIAYLLKHYGQCQGLYPIYHLFIDPVQGHKTQTVGDLKDLDPKLGHKLFILHFDPNHPIGTGNQAIFCDFWIDQLADDLKDIVEKLPERVRAYTRMRKPNGYVVLASPISDKEQDELRKANSYEYLRPLVHYTMKRMYELLTRQALPLHYYLVDEKVHPKTSKLYDNALSEKERKAFCEWDAMVMHRYVHEYEKSQRYSQAQKRLGALLKDAGVDVSVSATSTPTVNSATQKPNAVASYPEILLLSECVVPTSPNNLMEVAAKRDITKIGKP